jgi:hypothetical protein
VAGPALRSVDELDLAAILDRLSPPPTWCHRWQVCVMLPSEIVKRSFV